ncbi:MAG: alpha-amylase family glycosyl hydrolase [Treponema sp.]|nr:alpha-amylase family glycosyl hydrolase [Treponema sp.]
MKKLGKLLAGLIVGSATICLMSCVDSASSGPLFNLTTPAATSPVSEGYLRINYKGSEGNCVWIFGDGVDQSEKDKCSSWPDGIKFTGTNGDFKYLDVKLSGTNQSVGMIILDGSTKVCGDADINFLFPAKYNEIYLKKGDGTIYVSSDLSSKCAGLIGATVKSSNTVALNLDGVLPKEDRAAKVAALKDAIKVTIGGTETTVTNVADVNKVPTATISGDFSVDVTKEIVVTYTEKVGEKEVTDSRSAIFDESLVDEWFNATDHINELGYKNGKFTTWAPLASKVEVLLYDDMNNAIKGTVAKTEALVKGEKGLWSKTIDAGAKKYYKYRITTASGVKEVCDLWAKVAAKDSIATQIVDIDDPSAKPDGWDSDSFEFKGSYTDAVIYEMHITDWSQAFRGSIQKETPGTFKEIAEAVKGDFGKYLEDLGVTHVQILPMFEYAKVNKSADNKAEDAAYNWGYNPYNWNTPESRYVQDMKDGTDAVKQLREMILEFHKRQIAVNMDVVYNHTSGTGDGSIYDMTVPKYFYRTSETGYSNGSGCGNETATNHKMVNGYLIDSLNHWMKDYKLDGFRFDLMGLQEQETMKAVYESLSRTKSKVMVYGEPWTGGTAAVKNGVDKEHIDNCGGVACFNDDFRDAIKGKEFGGFKKGTIQGAYADEAICTGLIGSTGEKGFTNNPGHSINYVECHDNYTLFDKISISLSSDNAISHISAIPRLYKSFAEMTETEKASVIAQEKLAASYIFLAQGVPFINGGQEFMRTKQGDPDSYAADTKEGVKWTEIDEINAINFDFRNTYSEVYNVYKGLIALRKASNGAFGANTDATAENKSAGVTRYVTGDFLVYFNASDAAAAVDTKGYNFEVDISSGSVEKNAISSKSVPAKSFVIFKK